MINKLKNIKVLYIVVLLLTTYSTVFSQNSNLLYYFENVPQTNYTNPAMLPRANAFFSLPGLSSIAVDFKSDIAAKDLLQKHNGIWVQPLDAAFDYSKFYKSFGKSASVNAGLAYAPIYFGFRTKKGYFTFSMQEKVNAKISLPKDMFRIAEKGFENGDVLDLKSLDAKLMAYHEISIGYARQIDEKLTVGVHFKPLFGIAATKMKYNSLSIKNHGTSYNLKVDGDIYSSVPYLTVTKDEDGYPDEVEMQDDLEGSDIASQITPDFSNFGVAFDLGAVYDFNSSFTFSAALNNLGYINWKKNLNSVSANGTYDFEGPDVAVTEVEDMDEAYEDIVDEIKDVMQVNTEEKSFKTGLSPELMLGAAYHVNHVIDLGFLSKSTFAKYNFRQEFVVTTNFNLYKALSANFGYNYEIKGTSDLGLGLALRGGPFQVYLMANHIPFYYDKIESDGDEFIAPTKAESFSLMLGVNFVLGKHGNKNKSMID